LAAASSDGGYGGNNVGSGRVAGVSGANVYHHAVGYIVEHFIICLRTYMSIEQVKEPTRLGI